MPPLTILIAEDDREHRRSLRLLLEDAGYEAVEADGMRSALAAFRSAPPDLALLDHELGDGTSLDLIAAFAELGPPVSVILLTGAANAELIATATKHGARGFLTKPVRAQVLLAALEAALAHRDPSGTRG